MIVQTTPDVHLTYCLNVHPGETWDENFAAIREKALAVRRSVCPDKPFGLGLRLSAKSAAELIRRQRMDEFWEFLQQEDMYVFTINGFPYGQFHDAQVKQNVYAPDWQDVARVRYTSNLAEILAPLLPEGVTGSISTVPLSYRGWISGDQQVQTMVENLAQVAYHLRYLAEQGKSIVLSLEPEPDCLIESTQQTIDFFGRWSQVAVDYLVREFGLSPSTAHRTWSQHIGVCFDTAHAAVGFEDLAGSLHRLKAVGIPVGKVQLSSALQVRPEGESLRQLGQFADTVYLHQAKARSGDGTIHAFADLPEALAACQRGQFQELRVHYHVPLFMETAPDTPGDQAGALGSTSHLLKGEFAAALRAGAVGNVEIETYTFTVLPDFLRSADICEGISQEFAWVQRHVFPH